MKRRRRDPGRSRVPFIQRQVLNKLRSTFPHLEKNVRNRLQNGRYALDWSALPPLGAGHLGYGSLFPDHVPVSKGGDHVTQSIVERSQCRTGNMRRHPSVEGLGDTARNARERVGVSAK